MSNEKQTETAEWRCPCGEPDLIACGQREATTSGRLCKPKPIARHPGRTPAQRRVLDAIGCGNHSPLMSKVTRVALLDLGLIVECGERREQFVGNVSMIVKEYTMPIPVHMAWCAAMEAECEE